MTNENLGIFTAEEMELIKLQAIFMPVARKKLDERYKRQPASDGVADSARFVHYTSAEAALNIIKTRRLWMRNAMCMSDYREVQHGFDMLQRFFSDEANETSFKAALDRCVPGAAGEALALFDRDWNTTRLHTYITSISEHDSGEDLHGRLSMWRAFGGTTARVALVFNIPWNRGGTEVLNLLFSPVAYLTEEQVHSTLNEVIANINASRDFLGALPRETVVNIVLTMLLAGVTCLKHEGFGEEREWRVIYSPQRRPSTLMEVSTQTIGGVPQLVYNIPLDETLAPALAGIDFSRLFDRLIIGPTPYPVPMYEAFAAALTEAGIPQDTAKRRVFRSGIPIRV